MLLPRVLAARPSALIDGTISTVILLSMSRIAGSVLSASWRAIVKHVSRPEASLPWTLQLIARAGPFEIASTVVGGVGEPMMYMFTGRFWIVFASSTTRIRSLAASSAAVNAASSSEVV